MNKSDGNKRLEYTALEPCTPTNPNHHQQACGLSGADKGRQGVKVMGY